MEAKKFTVCNDGDTFRVGRGFVDAVSGPVRCSGTFEVANGKPLRFVSTLDGETSQRALSTAAIAEGKRITAFVWQNA